MATCGDAGFWAASDAVGVHTIPATGVASLVEGPVPPSLVMSLSRSGRAAAAPSLTLNLCVPSTTPAAYVVNAAPSALHLAAVSAGRFATLVSSVVTDSVIAAAYGGNATVLFRAGGAHSVPPAAVTLYWAKDAPASPPPLAELLPAFRGQVRWTSGTTRAAWFLTFNEASGVTVGDGVSAVSKFLNTVNASAQSLTVTWPPPAPDSASVAECVPKNMLPFVSIVTSVCVLTGTVVGILTYVYTTHRKTVREVEKV